MMDSFNLAWKLIYSIHGLTPDYASEKSDPIVDTYHTERHTIAHELIAFDRDFSSMFSGKIGASEDGVGGLTHDQFLEVFSRGNGFTSGCGIEYPENMTVDRTVEKDGKDPIQGTDYLSGLLRPGRRLLNVRLKRHADGYRRDLQDGLSLQAIYISIIPLTVFNRLPFNRPLPHPMPHVIRSSGSSGNLSKDTNCSWFISHSSLPQILD